MGADQVAAIRPLLVELDAAAAEGSPDFCAFFEVSGDEATWAEVVRGTLNFAYPFDEPPEDRLAALRVPPLPAWTRSEWQPGLYATFTYDPEAVTPREVARVVDQILGVVLGSGDDYPIDVEIKKLPAGEPA